MLATVGKVAKVSRSSSTPVSLYSRAAMTLAISEFPPSSKSYPPFQRAANRRHPTKARRADCRHLTGTPLPTFVEVTADAAEAASDGQSYRGAAGLRTMIRVPYKESQGLKSH